MRLGIIHSGGCTLGCMKFRINASDKDATNKRDEAIANAYGNKFAIRLDFEMLDSVIGPITSRGLETDYVTKSCTAVMVESLYH